MLRRSIICCLIIMGLSPSAMAAKKILTKPVVYEQTHSSITVTPKQSVFVIKLASNPTTGYVWSLAEGDSQSALYSAKHEYHASTSNLMGAGGFEWWTFSIKPAAFLMPQEIKLNFSYARPWENEKPEKKLTFTVVTSTL